MCARLKITYDRKRLLELAGLIDNIDSLITNPNLAPSEHANIIALSNDRCKLRPASFGLVPHWSKTFKLEYSTFNTRVETAHEKPAFKASFAKRHCLIPVCGFYEWVNDSSNKKQPYLFTRIDKNLIYFAGIWSRCIINNEERYSFSILTTEPDEHYKQYHHRKPIILKDEDRMRWLKNDRSDTFDFTNQLASEHLCINPVSKAVNNPSMKDLDLINIAQ